MKQMNRVYPENVSVYASKLTQRSRGNWTGPAAQETCLKHLRCLLNQISDRPVRVHSQNLQPCTFLIASEIVTWEETASATPKRVLTQQKSIYSKYGRLADLETCWESCREPFENYKYLLLVVSFNIRETLLHCQHTTAKIRTHITAEPTLQLATWAFSKALI